MDKIIKNVLKNLENHGFEAYIVGGYVRDLLVGVISYDVDICTNALPKDLHNIFPSTNNSNNYGGFNLRLKKSVYNYTIFILYIASVFTYFCINIQKRNNRFEGMGENSAEWTN